MSMIVPPYETCARADLWYYELCVRMRGKNVVECWFCFLCNEMTYFLKCILPLQFLNGV
jgi:hypothetical protein